MSSPLLEGPLYFTFHSSWKDIGNGCWPNVQEGYAITKLCSIQGLADVAYGCAPGEREAQFTQVDLEDADQVFLMGVSEEQHQEHCKELSRLQALWVA